MTTYFLLFLLDHFLSGRHADPSPGVVHGKADVRNLECTRLSQAVAHDRRPGEVAEPSPRVTWDRGSALVCRQRYVRLGERDPRDEAVLSSLGRHVGDITREASAAVAGDVVWHVDAFYPDLLVSAKIAVAAKTNLVETGRSVSDRVPLLAAGDLAVFGKLSPVRSLPMACVRYFAEGSLGPRDVLLAIALLDEQETQLHGGLCQQGTWRWLR
ncbi:MAG: hypothetical protein KA712_23795 [Myxococcales bacterium]|nr:hypothetical protein [Myxococcales bacterium]